MKHRCHAIQCEVTTHPSMLMCLDHWNKLPLEIKKRVMDNFNPNQCTGLVRPSKEWLKAAREAITFIKELK